MILGELNLIAGGGLERRLDARMTEMTADSSHMIGRERWRQNLVGYMESGHMSGE